MADKLTGKPSPVKRFIELLGSEKRVIGYIYVYAIISGLVNLSLPLGIQSLIGFVSGGQLVTSVTVLILFIVVGVLVVGGLQVMQLSLVETIQQRIFATKAFEFSTHLTQLDGRQLAVQNLPEMMNRFFDVVSLQKGLAKILTDLSGAAIQIVFGLLLLSFYHSYFIIFGILLVVILITIMRLTSPKGMRTSLEESKYKYKLVHWLEEVARNITVFKAASQERLSLEKTDAYTSSYLKAREAHFRVLITQYITFVGFKTVITASLLLMGSLLLVNQEINLGQFVASEIIIILIINAVEKLLVKLDVVYDVLTSLEKLGAVTDLPLEERKELSTRNPNPANGIAVQIKGVGYRYSGTKKVALRDVHLAIEPGEKVCLAGPMQAGRSTLLQLLAGIITDYEGIVVINGLSLREYDPQDLHEQMGLMLMPGVAFEGTVLENITMGQPSVTLDDVLWALECVELAEYVQALPGGLQTKIRSHSPDMPDSVAQRLALARSIAHKPKLLLLDNFLPHVSNVQRVRIGQRLLAPHLPWTALIISNDPNIIQQCTRVVLMQDGTIVREVSKEAAARGELKNIL